MRIGLLRLHAFLHKLVFFTKKIRKYRDKHLLVNIPFRKIEAKEKKQGDQRDMRKSTDGPQGHLFWNKRKKSF